MSTTALKVFLRRSPWLDRRLKTLYYALREVGERHVVGTRLQEWLWKRRSESAGREPRAAYAESLSHPHRALLLAAIGAHGPLESIFEVGCGLGPNLHLLSLALPQARLLGIDVNADALAEADTRFKALGIENCELECRNLEALREYPDRSVDVVFTDAVLMYVGPDKIRGALREMLRVARKAVIFSEWHQPGQRKPRERPAAHYHYGHWIYDYADLLSEFLAPERVTVTRYGESTWADANWKTFGCLITASTGPTSQVTP